MRDKKPVLFILLFAGAILLVFLLMQPAEIHYSWGEIDLLFPVGKVALKERNLLFIIQILMLLVVIPVYILTFAFSWFYRAHNKNAKYDPDYFHNPIAESIWWGIPLILVLIIGAITWMETYRLDPFKPLQSDKKPMTIQVVALQWKWLFIYPEENIAVVNYLQIPEKTPIRFEITSDAPMNSFWIPSLSGQIYAMPKMRTELHVIADKPGVFRGCSANISGKGFSGMHFVTKATSQEDFQKWVQEATQADKNLNWEEYQQLVLPSENNPVTLYRLGDEKLFDEIIMKYMHPSKHE